MIKMRVVVVVAMMMMMMTIQHLKESGRHFGTGSSSNCSKDTGTTLEYLREGPDSCMFVDALLLFIIFRIFSHEAHESSKKTKHPGYNRNSTIWASTKIPLGTNLQKWPNIGRVAKPTGNMIVSFAPKLTQNIFSWNRMKYSRGTRLPLSYMLIQNVIVKIDKNMRYFSSVGDKIGQGEKNIISFFRFCGTWGEFCIS